MAGLILKKKFADHILTYEMSSRIFYPETGCLLTIN